MLLKQNCTRVARRDDKNCLEESNAEAGVAALTMKYAFDAEGFEKLLPQIAEMLKKLDKSRAACLVEKIELYLQKPLRLSNKIKQA